FGGISDFLLTLSDAGHVGMHDLRADLHVSDGMVAEGLRIAFPYFDALRHQLSHRRLEVVVAYDSTSDPRGTGADPGLVDDENVRSAASSPGLQLQPEVICRAQTVDARPNDEVFRVRWHHVGSPAAQNFL